MSELTADQVWHKINAREDVDEREVRALVNSAERKDREIAHIALARTRIRQTLQTFAELAQIQGYADAGTVSIVEQLARICDFEGPYLTFLKQQGLEAARRGQVDRALDLLQSAVVQGTAAAQKGHRRSRELMRFAHDSEIGDAVQSLVGALPRPRHVPQCGDPLAMTVICSSLQNEDGPTVVTVKRTALFRELGFEVELLSTELAATNQTEAIAALESTGIPFKIVPPGTWRQRIAWMTSYFEQNSRDIAMFEASGVDLLAQLIAALEVAPVQVWGNKGFEPQAGSYQIVAQALSPEQERLTKWPGASKFYGAAVALGDEIDAAQPFSHEQLGLPEHAVILGTFGRIEKCLSEPYLEALARILRLEANAWLVLAGPDSFSHLEKIMSHLRRAGVADRVKYLGRRQSEASRLIKSIDIYCDTYPWPGGQSLQDAMWAGVPVVAMRKADDQNLDPFGTNVGAIADVLLGDIVELAPAGDAVAYASQAVALIQNAASRARMSERLREKAVRECSMRTATERLAMDMRKLAKKERDNGRLH